MENKPSLFNRLDAYLIDKAQRAYLWVFDWTGVYVATLSFCCVLFPMGLSIMHSMKTGTYVIVAIQTVALAMNGLVLIKSYIMQDKGDHTRFNVVAMMLREFPPMLFMRWLMVFLSITGCMQMLLTEQYIRSVFEIGWATYGFLTCVMIRERNPKEFWKPAPRLAEVRSS